VFHDFFYSGPSTVSVETIWWDIGGL
jgi:hypothetical protein